MLFQWNIYCCFQEIFYVVSIFPWNLQCRKWKKRVTNTGWLTNLHRTSARIPPTLSKTLFFLIIVFLEGEGVAVDPVKCAKMSLNNHCMGQRACWSLVAVYPKGVVRSRSGKWTAPFILRMCHIGRMGWEGMGWDGMVADPDFSAAAYRSNAACVDVTCCLHVWYSETLRVDVHTTMR